MRPNMAFLWFHARAKDHGQDRVIQHTSSIHVKLNLLFFALDSFVQKNYCFLVETFAEKEKTKESYRVTQKKRGELLKNYL